MLLAILMHFLWLIDVCRCMTYLIFEACLVIRLCQCIMPVRGGMMREDFTSGMFNVGKV
jgi:hypothetical protein